MDKNRANIGASFDKKNVLIAHRGTLFKYNFASKMRTQ